MSERTKLVTAYVVGIVVVVIVLTARVSCQRAALERVTGRPVSLWDAILLGGR